VPAWAVTALAGLAEGRSRLTGREPYPSLGQARMSRLFWFANSDRARSELGYQTRPLEQTLADAFDWHQAREPIVLRGIIRWWARPRRAA
jgi:dihydroflavonol-4-reductase